MDITISSDLKTLTAAWMGDTTLLKAMREKALRLSGYSRLKKTIHIWMGTNYYADVKPAR